MYFPFYHQWDVGSSPSVERWCILLSSSSVVRRCISLSTSSGTLVVHLQWNVGVFCYLHRQWYVDVFSFIPSVECGYVLSLVVRRYISFYLQWDVGSSPSVEHWCILLSSSSVVRRCISLSASSGTLVVHLQWNVGVFWYLHRQWYVDVFLFLPPVGRW